MIGYDDWIETVSDINELTNENIERSLECHKKVLALFKKATRLDRRSFVSKYLHFHAPNAFFIYDSIANRRVKEAIKRLPYNKHYP
jgi:hypothetical protein